MTRVIHTGDTHLGYRQYHSPERESDFLSAFRRVIKDAIADDVDAVVHAGDLFHDRRPPISAIHGTIDVLRELRAADIPFLAIVGNHERTRGQQWLDLFETVGLASRLGSEPVRVEDVAFYGLDFVPRSKRDDLEYEFPAHDASHAALVAHGLFTPFNPEWDIEHVLQSAPVSFDAVLLGDDHHPDTARVEETWVTYCGSTERTSTAEREERGYNIVEFDDDVAISRRGIETRQFVLIDITLAPGEGIDRVRQRVREEDVEDAVVVVTIEGDGEDIPAAPIEEFATDRGALIARVSDRREVDEVADAPDVSFADPDEAVRERIHEMGLSTAARALDSAVRDNAIADANVRDRVRETVEELLDDDSDAFSPADAVEDRTHAKQDRGNEEPAGATGGSESPAADEPPDPDRESERAEDGDAVDGEATTMEDFL